MRNNPDWLLRFLVQEASDFSAQIHFLDLTVFGLLAGLYNFSMLAFFHLHSLPGLPDHPVLDFCLPDLLLRFFLTWRWIRRSVYWILGWIVDRSWQILKRPKYHILTGVQANHVWAWFALLPFGCPNGRRCSLEISPDPDKIDTSWDWRTISAFAVDSAPIKWLVRALRLRFRCRWRCHRGILSRKCRASLLGSY